MAWVVVAVASLVAGAVAGVLISKTISAANAQSAEAKARRAVLDAEREAEDVLKTTLSGAKEEIAAMRREVEEDLRQRREEIAARERRLDQAQEQGSCQPAMLLRGQRGVGRLRMLCQCAFHPTDLLVGL